MKKLMIIIIMPFFGFGQFNTLYNDNEGLPILTKSPENTIFLELNSLFLNTIQESKPCNLSIMIPFFDEGNLKLELQYFEVFTEDFQVARTTNTNFIVNNYSPSIVSYKIHGENNISGSISITKNRLVGVIKKEGKIYEILYIENNTYALVDMNDTVEEFNFTCQTNTKDFSSNTIINSELEGGSGVLCLNMAIDIDYYTYTEFNYNCNDAVEWALAILTGVSEIYMLDLNVLLQASYVHVWESINDPYSGDDMYEYLNDLENTWNSSWNFNSVDRDIVHLFTRQSVGGGLANLDALCSNWQGYAVTGGMSETINYDYLSLPYSNFYSWNFTVVSHELGHNIGASHTHDCLWDANANYSFSGGAIDNCDMYSSLFDAESSCYGNPSGIFLNSTYDYGTIMSYCHVTSLVPLYLEFHPIVKTQALMPGLINSCLNGNCVTLSYECGAPLDDADGDGILDEDDNCIDDFNISQSDNDGDGVGNACDNCIQNYNITQSDNDGDGVGNVCDNCYSIYNPEQIDTDDDGNGDACDSTPIGLSEKSNNKFVLQTVNLLGQKNPNRGFAVKIFNDGSVEKIQIVK